MTRNRFRVALTCIGLFVLQAALVVAADDALSPTGRPKQFEKGKHTTYAIWEDEGTWHIRTAVQAGAKGKVHRVQFSGTVTVKGDKVERGEYQGLEKKPKAKDADWVFVHEDGRGFDFQFSTTNTNTDGLTFKLGPKAEAITFKLLTAGDDDPKRILVGSKGVNPPKATFTFPVAPPPAKEPN